MKSESERYSLSVRLPSETIKRIETSGERPSDWLRRAVRLRMEREQQAGNTLDAVDGRMGRLEQEATQLRKEIAKLQQSDATLQALLADLRKVLATVQKNQVEVHALLVGIDRNFGNALNALGPSLLAVLSQQLRDILKAKDEEEPPPFKLPPIPPRTRL